MKNHSHIVNSLRVILLFPIALLISYVMSLNPSWAEWYALNIYPVFSGAINTVSGKVSVSVAEIVVIVFFSLILLYTVCTLLRVIAASGKRLSSLLNYVLNIAAIASIIFFIFTFLCGINYHRKTFSEVCGLEITESSSNDLSKLCSGLADEVIKLRSEIPSDENGVAKTEDTFSELSEKCREAYDLMEAEYPTLVSGYSAAKPVYFSSMMSYSGIIGVFFPFTYEANVDTDVPVYTQPAAICHELTHLRGYMREDEANFIAYLVCKKSGDKFVEYSGYMLAFSCSLNKLYSADRTAYLYIVGRLGDDVLCDLRYEKKYWTEHEGVIESISDKINDGYLKINNQQDGVESYGRMVDLLIAEMKASETEQG